MAGHDFAHGRETAVAGGACQAPSEDALGVSASCSACVAGVGVTPHGLDVAIADITGALLAEAQIPKTPSESYLAGPELHRVIDEAASRAGIAVKDLDQVVVGLPGIVDIQSATHDDPSAVPPRAHIQVAERIGWMERAHELPTFERYPPQG